MPMRSIERLRDGHHELSERFNLVQGRFYSVGGDIARIEQSIQHGQQRLRQLQDDFKKPSARAWKPSRTWATTAPCWRPWVKSWTCSCPSRS